MRHNCPNVLLELVQRYMLIHRASRHARKARIICLRTQTRSVQPPGIVSGTNRTYSKEHRHEANLGLLWCRDDAVQNL